MFSFPIGTSSFKDVRQSQNKPIYLDKTPLIHEIFTFDSKTLLFTRPPRFMKTTNMDMVATFCDCQCPEENAPLFDGLKIKDHLQLDYANTWNSHFGQYPVIFLSLKNMPNADWTESFESFKGLIARLYKQHNYLLESKYLAPTDKETIEQFLNKTADMSGYKNSLLFLSDSLALHYQKKVVILIDEYDTPLHYAHVYDKTHPGGNSFEPMLNLLKSFFKAGLKDNISLKKSIITGVLRTAFGSLISELNNVDIFGVLAHTPKFSSYFGVTEEDIQFLMQTLHVEEKNLMQEVLREYYNGYNIAGVTLYNPWSIMKYLRDYTESQGKALRGAPYWLQTGDSGIIGLYLREHYAEVHEDLQHLLTMEPLHVYLDDRNRFSSIEEGGQAAFWGLLLQCGYLTVLKIRNETSLFVECDVRIPNLEVYGAFVHYMRLFLVPYSANEINFRFMKSLLDSDFERFKKYLQEYLTQVVSYFDTHRKINDTWYNLPEMVLHVLMMGLVAGLHQGQYLISSNRESGSGRHDLMLLPCAEDRPGIIFEFKKADSLEDLEQSAKYALRQIQDKQYAQGFDAYGVKTGVHVGLAFFGKDIHLTYESVVYKPTVPFRLRESVADLMCVNN